MRKRLLAMLLVIAMIIPMGTCLPVSASSSDKLTLLSATAIDNWTIELKFSEDLRTNDDGSSWVVEKSTAYPNGWLAGVALVSDEPDATTGYFTRKSEVSGTVSPGETADTLIWKASSPSETTSLLYLQTTGKQEGYSLKFYVRDLECSNWGLGYIWGIQATYNGTEKPLSVPESMIGKTGSANHEHLYIDINTEAANFELLSATVVDDYHIELAFSQDLRTVLVDTDSDGVGDTSYIVNYLNKDSALAGLAKVSNEKHAEFNNYYGVSNNVSGTFAMGDDNKTLIWTSSQSISQVKTNLAADGYSVKFYFYEGSAANFSAALNSQSVVTVFDSYGYPLWIPEEYRRNFGSSAQDYMFMDLTSDELELVSVESIDEYSLKITFSEAVDAANSSKLYANLRLRKDDGTWYLDANGKDWGYNIGEKMKTTDDPAVLTWTMPTQYTGIGSTYANEYPESGRSITYALDTWEAAIAEGYKPVFVIWDDAAATFDVNDPATYPGYSVRIKSADGGYLKTSHVSGDRDYAFKEFSKYISELELESVTQVGSYQIELKFNQDLRTTTRNGQEFILDILNNTGEAEVGLAWVKDGWTTADSFTTATTGAIEGTVAFGDSKDTLIWTISEQIPANRLPALLREEKDGYTVKFYLRDVACGWHGVGKIGAIQAFPNNIEKALVIPDDYKRGDGTAEYYFVDVAPETKLEVKKATAIGDYQVKLEFNQPLTDGTLALINTNKNAYLGIGWVLDGYTGQEAFTAVVPERVDGSVAFGDDNYTLIWTAGNQTTTIDAMLKETKAGYTRMFYFWDHICEYHGSGYIGGVQATNPSGATVALSIPDANKKTADAGIQEFVFIGIDSFVGYEQGKTVALEDKAYNFMNADTGRSLTVGEVDEFTIVRKAADSNLVMLKVGEKYVDLHTTPATLSDTAYYYLLEACENKRYRLLITPDLALADGDTGTGNEASLTYMNSAIKPISTGWYLTASGDAKPLRILPIGDSITYGSNPDGYAHGWRDTLSENLMDQFGRVVFVGSQTSKNSSVNEKALYRHEGNPGWTVSYIQQDVSLDSIATGVVNKYDPDVVLLMAGINDMGSLDAEGYSDDEARAYLKGAYKTLLEKLKANMDEDDVIFCSTLTPTFYEEEDNPAVINAVFPSWVKEWAAEGMPVALNDNYTGIENDSSVCCSDKLHLSSDGDAFVAQQYANSILNYYNTDGTEMDLQQKITAAKADGLEEFYLNSDETITEVNVPDGITLDLNGHTLTTSYMISTGNVIDSTEGKGLVKIAKNDTADNSHLLVVLPTNNTMLPLYDTANGGYRFFNCTATQLYNEGTAKFGIQLDINDTGLALLKDAANADVEVVNNIVVTVDDKDIVTKEFVFQASTVATYATKMLDDPRNWAITLTVSGFDKLSGTNKSMTSTPSVRSSTGVSVAPSENGTVTYTYKQGE